MMSMKYELEKLKRLKELNEFKNIIKNEDAILLQEEQQVMMMAL
jgi:hypothetical protein